MGDSIIGPAGLPGVGMQAWLLRFNKHGACESPQTQDALIEAIKSRPAAPLILFSHGWNNAFDEAAELYAAFVKQLETHRAQGGAAGPAPIFVGVIWPSIWLSFSEGPQIAAGAGDKAEEAQRQDIKAGLDAAERTRFDELMAMNQLTGAPGGELVSLVARGLAAQGGSRMSEGAEHATPGPGDLLNGLRALETIGKIDESDDGELGDGGTVGSAGTGNLQSAGLLSALDPRRLLRLASVYQMKDRAGIVGSNGVAALLGKILANATGGIHLVGHSYGCKVILSAMNTVAGARKVTSALLLQPAVSHLSFAETVPGREGPGGYRAVLGRIEKSTALTFSAWDFPLHTVFHLALRRETDLGELGVAGGDDQTAGDPPSDYAALGGYGPRRAGEKIAHELPAPGTALPQLLQHGLFAFDGTKDHKVSSHGDVTTAHVAWLLHQQMGA